MKNKLNNTNSQLFESISQWAKLNLLFLSLTFILRLAFLGILFFTNNVEFSSFPAILSGIYFDLLLVAKATAILAIPFLALYYFIPKITNGIYIGLITLYCITYACLIGYYSNVMLPLDNVLFVYGTQELINIVTSSVTFSFMPFIGAIAAIVLYIIYIRFWNKKIIIRKWFAISFLAVSVIFALIFNYKAVISNDKPYKTYSNYCLAVNQLGYTANKINDYFIENKSTSSEWADQYELYDKSILDKARDYHALFPERTYVDSLYPFMRLANDKDVLGDFMNKTSDGTAPNFVFIIIESFGQNLTAFQPAMSYTPFIDSLASQSLYWRNCLGLSERTFGVLPNVFSSTPYDKSGFARPWFPIPDHNSILKDMSKNDYTISYFHGGNAAFDGQDAYLSNNGVSFIMQPKDEDFDKEAMQLMKDNNSWGIYDMDMFKAAIQHKDTINVNQPFTDIYLTLTTHEPFYFKGIKEYEKRVVEMIESTPDVPQSEKNRILDNKNVYACYLYADDCLRMIMDYYKKQPYYENTIFVITGDHRMGRLYVNASELLKYTVPLLIYSPLLKEPKTFNSVVTHHDITPTINAFLNNNYDYQIDETCHWLGSSLDTTVAFSSKVIVPFMRNNRDVNELLFHDKFLVRDRLFVIDENLYPTEIKDNALARELSEHLSNYKSIDHYVTQYDFLLPKPTEKIENVLNLSLKTDSTLIDKVIEMPKNNLYEAFRHVRFDKDYEKIYVDIIYDYKTTDDSEHDKFEFVFKMFSNHKSIMYKGYQSDALSSNIPGKPGWKRLRVKTTCFFAQPATKDAIMQFFFLSNGDTTLQIDDFNIKIDAVPLQ